MTPIPKPPVLSESLHDAIQQHARASLPMSVRRNPLARGDTESHHLRPVFHGQRRRSNPIVVPLQTSEHQFLHDNPEYEAKIEYRLYLKALDMLCRGDTDTLKAAIRGAIYYLSELDETR